MGRRTFIDDLVAKTNSSTGARYQGSSVKIIPITPRVEASVSTAENTRGVATPLGVPAEEGRISVVGESDQEAIYHINKNMVTKEERT